MAERKPSKLESQVLAVYESFKIYGIESDEFQRYLIGMFEMLYKEFPETVRNIRKDAFRGNGKVDKVAIRRA